MKPSETITKKKKANIGNLNEGIVILQKALIERIRKKPPERRRYDFK